MRIKKIPKHNFILTSCDTDSIAFCKEDQSEITKKEQEDLLNEINSLMNEGISFAHDGFFSKVIIFKAKNYILYDPTNKDPKKVIQTKGSSLKATTLEPKLKEFLNNSISLLLKEKEYKDKILNNYKELAFECIKDSLDIDKWCFRKGLTSKSLDSKTTNTTALKIQAALEQDEDNEDGYEVMDRVFMYFDKDMNLKLTKFYNNDHNKEKMLEKLYKTGIRLEEIIGKGFFLNYSLKKNYKLLQQENIVNLF